MGHINTRHPDFIGGTKESLAVNTAKDEDADISRDQFNTMNNHSNNNTSMVKNKDNNRKIFEPDPSIGIGVGVNSNNKMNTSMVQDGINNYNIKNNNTSFHFSYSTDYDQNSLNRDYMNPNNVVTTSLGKVPDKIIISNTYSKREKNEINLIKKMI